MKEKIFNELKEDYFEKHEKNEKNKKRLEALKQRRDFLKNNILVKQYIELQKDIKKHSSLILSEDEILDSTLSYFDEVSLDDENNIFVYLGSYVYDDYTDLLQVGRDDEDVVPAYNIYGNLETKETLVLDYEDCEEFERENNILVIYDFPGTNLLYDVRNEYFKDAFENGQKEAASRLLRRIKNNK